MSDMQAKKLDGPYISILTDKLVFNDGGGGRSAEGGTEGAGEDDRTQQQQTKKSSKGVKYPFDAQWPPRQQLCKLMESRGAEAIVKINNEFGGVEGICQRLTVDQVRGLTKDAKELAKRREMYGSNTVPSAKAKSFVRLLFDASKDPTLIILIVAGFVSLGLSFVESGRGGSGGDAIFSTDNGTSASALAMQLDQQKANRTFDGETPFSIRTSNISLQKPPDKREQSISANATKEDETKEEEEHESAWIEGAAILVCVVVVVFVTAVNDFSKERQFRGLHAKIETGHKFSVVRDNEAIDIPVSELVVGDIARVKYGDLIPADGILLQSNDLKVDESSLTGESDHVSKSVYADPVLLSGTYAMEGSAKMVVVAVGVHSQTGIIMTLLGGGKLSRGDSSSDSDSDSSDTSSTTSGSASSGSSRSSSSSSAESGIHSKSILQTKLSALALRIIYCGASMALFALAWLIVRYCYDAFIVKQFNQNAEFHDHLRHFVKFFIIAVTIIVISIPEGLPLAIALSLTYSVRKMMKDNNLVRHLDACETMGNATTICSDKTGTLTTNRMTVVQSFLCERYFGEEKSQPKPGEFQKELVTLLSEAITVNCAYNSMIVEPKKAGERIQQLGNKTECALLGWVRQIGGDYEKIRREYMEEDNYRVYTFNSSRKMMMTVVELKNGAGRRVGFRVFVKGASEILLNKCAFFLDANGSPTEFTEHRRKRIIGEVIQRMAEDGLRTLTIAYKDYVLAGERTVGPTEVPLDSEAAVNWDDEQSISDGVVGLAICGIQDPVRDEVPDAIEKCRRAGITVRMVTGDNVNTARAIAIRCGILRPDEDFLVLEGKEFNDRIRDGRGKIDQRKLDMIWPRLRVLARAQPADKYTLVKGIIDSKLNTQREIVAVTGDGTNDGPALKKADVGFAMGIAGTDVAKEASDIILTNDNFSSIVKAVMWGRNVYDSISKFLQFQLTVNLVAVFTAVVSACTIADSPLKAVHMLWLNLIMDTLASLALATEMPTEELLERKPYGRKKSLISRTMIRNIFCHAVYQFTILMVLLFKGPELLNVASGIGASIYSPPSEHFTIIFNSFVLMTLFNEINSRKVHGERNVFKHLSSNHMFCIIWLSTFLAQFLIVHFGHKWFSTARLNLSQWLVCLALGLSELVYGQLVAFIPTKKCVPKSLALYRGIVIPSKLHLHRRQPPENVASVSGPFASQSMSRGRALWLRGIELIGIHYRVCYNLHEFLLGRRALGATAPTMTAEVAEKWRQSYRHYRQRKHFEKKLRNSIAAAVEYGTTTTTTSAAHTVPAFIGSSAHYSNSPSSTENGTVGVGLPPRRCKSVTVIETPSHLSPSERRARRHLRVLLRPASLDCPAEENGGGEEGHQQPKPGYHRRHHYQKRRPKSEERQENREENIDEDGIQMGKMGE
ncbi:hypothetical protein niasHS_014609 [Heterodera schachtii]|uniref:Calcium-transporting ATPase n=1 Tax=Heterodera schachtii TaxID=97005 RepID=A0ABD2ILA9_HETSC